MDDAPSLVPDLDDMVSDAALAAAIATIQRLSDAKREGDRDAMTAAAVRYDSVPGLRETVHQVANGKTYAEIQGSRGAKRKRELRTRNERIAREYQRRELSNAVRGEPIGFTSLAIQIGRLPEYNLKKNAAINAIRDGLKIVNRHRTSSSPPGALV